MKESGAISTRIRPCSLIGTLAICVRNRVGWADTTTSAFLREAAPYVMTTYPSVDRLMLGMVSGFSIGGYFKGTGDGPGAIDCCLMYS